MKRHRPAAIEPLESRLHLTVGELVRNGALEGTVATTDWVRGSAWQAGYISSSFTYYHGGTGYAFNGSSAGAYIHNTNGSAGEIYQELTIPAGTSSPVLQVWTKITTEETTTTTAYDTMVIQVKNTSGAVLATLKTLSNLDAGSGGPYTANGKYTLHTFDMTPYVGQTVRISFQVTTDGSKGTMFRVDDVSLAPPGAVKAGTTGQVVAYLPDYRYSLFGQMDLNYVTHVNYFSVGFASNGTLTQPTSTFNSHLDTVVAAAHAKGAGVSITTGPGQPYTTMAGSSTYRAKLVSDLKNYVLAHNLDGVDIDWETPARAADQVNYGLLIDDLYATFAPLGKKITAAVNPWIKEIPVPASQKMDWINVMCYDFDYANHSTYAASTDGMLQWYYYGVAKNKLTMGVPFYGKAGTSWSDDVSKSYGAILTDYKTLNGSYPAYNVDSYVASDGKTYHFNGLTTMQMKMAFVRESGFAGAMIWELGHDHWDAAVKYDNYSMLPVVHTMLRPPAWLNPATGARFNLVAGSFYLHSGSASVTSDISSASPNLNVSVFSGAALTFAANQKLANLSIADGGKAVLSAGGNKTLRLSTLSMTSAGTLDLNDNDFVVNSGSFSGIRALVFAGFSDTVNPAKTGIVSSTSQAGGGATILALLDNALLGTGVWPVGSAQTVGGSAILGKYTWFGDVNLDGQVTSDDYSLLDSNLNTAPAPGIAWLSGDANLDGSITADDYAVLDTYLGRGVGNPLTPAAAGLANSPEIENLSLSRTSKEVL